MCGLVGVLTTEVATVRGGHLAYFKQALYADALRGVDGTGVATFHVKGGEAEYFKKGLRSSDFLQLTEGAASVDYLVDKNYYLGHNRAGTIGAVGDATAHPFRAGPIVMAHNGTLKNHRALKCKGVYDVDSEALVHAIHETGLHEVIPLVNGAFSLTWIDEEDSSMNFLRNEERPMYFAQCKGEDTILYASEPGMLSWLASRPSVGLKIESITALPVGVHRKFTVVEGSLTYIDTPVTLRAPTPMYPAVTEATHAQGAAKGARSPEIAGYIDEIGGIAHGLAIVPMEFKAYRSTAEDSFGTVRFAIISDSQSRGDAVALRVRRSEYALMADMILLADVTRVERRGERFHVTVDLTEAVMYDDIQR